MRLFSLIMGCVVSLSAIVPAYAAPISLFEGRKDAAMGIHVDPTGPTDLPVVLGWSEVYGSTAAFLTNSVTARYYSGSAVFDAPISRITFDVERINESGWRNPITIVGLSHHKRVAAAVVNLNPLGDLTQVTLSAPSINQVKWTGTNWIYRPFVIRDIQVSYASAGTGMKTPDVGSRGGVGSAVPEPGSCAIFGVIGVAALLRRRRPLRKSASDPNLNS